MRMIIETIEAKFRAAFRFFRRSTAKAEAAEPDRTASIGTMNWLSPPSGVARTWEEALGAHREVGGESDPAKQPLS